MDDQWRRDYDALRAALRACQTALGVTGLTFDPQENPCRLPTTNGGNAKLYDLARRVEYVLRATRRPPLAPPLKETRQ